MFHMKREEAIVRIGLLLTVAAALALLMWL